MPKENIFSASMNQIGTLAQKQMKVMLPDSEQQC